jgi:hypothetical protein
MKKFVLSMLIMALVVSCQQSKTEWATRKILQDKPQLSTVNLRDTALDQGDGVAFEAVLRDTTGTEVGEVHGWLVAIDLEDSITKAANNNLVDKIGTMVVNLDGDDIVVVGETSYNRGQQVMKDNMVQKRAIIGGTGKYRGITGEVLTTRNSDGTHTHEMIYKINQ